MGSELEHGLNGASISSSIHSVLKTMTVDPRRRVQGYIFLDNQAKVSGDVNTLEYDTPECLGPQELALHEAAALDSIAAIVPNLQKELPDNKKLSFHRADRNTEIIPEEKSNLKVYCPANSFGSCHGNYLTFGRLDLKAIAGFLSPALLTRWMLIGNGWVDVERNKIVFVLSQRAGLLGETEAPSSAGEGRKKPLIGTREEAHADTSIWRRYHDVSGNQNMSEWQCYLKHAVMDLMLMLMEEDPRVIRPLPPLHDYRFGLTPDNYQLMRLADFFNADLFGTNAVQLADGSKWSALKFQQHYITEVERYKHEGRGPFTKEREEALNFWKFMIDALERKDLPLLARYLDWAAILYYVIRPILERLGYDLDMFIGPEPIKIPYDTPVITKNGETKIVSRMHQSIIHYANVNREESIHGLLVRKGLMEKMFTLGERAHAQKYPPARTKASCREELMSWAINSEPPRRFKEVDWTVVSVLDEKGRIFKQYYANPYRSFVRELRPDNYHPEKLFTVK